MNPRAVYEWWPLADVARFDRREVHSDIAMYDPAPVTVRSLVYEWFVVVKEYGLEREVVIPSEVIQEMTDDSGAVIRWSGDDTEAQVRARFVESVNAAAEATAARYVG